jgi:hypothetical protein
MEPNTRESIEWQRRKMQRQLEKGIEQPSCGCRVVCQWRYLHQFEPAGIALISIERCHTPTCLGHHKVLTIAEAIMRELTHRLRVLQERPDAVA